MSHVCAPRQTAPIQRIQPQQNSSQWPVASHEIVQPQQELPDLTEIHCNEWISKID
jgi:hypothetical protein